MLYKLFARCTSQVAETLFTQQCFSLFFPLCVGRGEMPWCASLLEGSPLLHRVYIVVIYELTRCLTLSDHSNTLDQHLYYMWREIVSPLLNSANVFCQVEGNLNLYMGFLSEMLVQYNEKCQFA